MKKFFRTCAYVSATIMSCALVAQDNYVQLTNAADFPEFIKNDKVVALFVYPPGQPCKNMMASATRVASEDASLLLIVVDIRTFPALRKQYHVGGLPSMILFKNGQELARTTGQRDANSLKIYLAKIFNGSTKAFLYNPVAYTAAWIKGHFKTNPVCENQ